MMIRSRKRHIPKKRRQTWLEAVRWYGSVTGSWGPMLAAVQIRGGRWEEEKLATQKKKRGTPRGEEERQGYITYASRILALLL
jgi:hypothetical protein